MKKIIAGLLGLSLTASAFAVVTGNYVEVYCNTSGANGVAATVSDSATTTTVPYASCGQALAQIPPVNSGGPSSTSGYTLADGSGTPTGVAYLFRNMAGS